MTIQHVSDTARWVAVYRAMESERPDAIFRDPYARRLAGAEGEAIVKWLKRGRAMAWPMIVRTKVFDELILDRVHRGGADLVLNLAAGLDARPWRLPLPALLDWVDVDLPALLEYKASMMSGETPVCRYQALAADLTDPGARQAVFTRLGADHRAVVVVTEGLLVYLEAAQVVELARDLHRQPSFRWWITDLASPRLLKFIERSWGRQLRSGNAPMRFAPAEGTGFFRQAGWREVEWRSTGEEAHRLKRGMRLMWLWRLLGRLGSAERREQRRRFAGSVLLEREDPARA